MSEISAGTIVQLRCGGPRMVVAEANDGRLKVCWINPTTGGMEWKELPPEAFRIVQPDEPS